MDQNLERRHLRPDADRGAKKCGVFGNSRAILTLPPSPRWIGRAAAPRPGGLRHRQLDGKRFHADAVWARSRQLARRDVTDRLHGHSAIGHARYSTTGDTFVSNVGRCSPIEGGGIAIGHHGNLTNCLTLRRQLVDDGAMMQSTSNSEVILHLIVRARRTRIVDRFIEGLREIEGGYALVGITNRSWSASAPLGIRPLVLGELDGCRILASETCALDMIGAHFVRDIENGEMVTSTRTAYKRRAVRRRWRPALHLPIHLSRARIRRRRPPGLPDPQEHGRRLAREVPLQATSSCRCPTSACRPRSATRRRPASLRAASSATTMSAGPPSNRPRSAARPACGSSIGQPRGGERQADGADRRLHRARHHLDRAWR